jgi:hypothetical protein
MKSIFAKEYANVCMYLNFPNLTVKQDADSPKELSMCYFILISANVFTLFVNFCRRHIKIRLPC